MLERLKKSVQSYTYNKTRANTIKQIKRKLSAVKGFQLKDLFLAEDNITAIAIDRTSRSLNLISVENNDIKTCLVQYSDLIAIELFKRGRCAHKLSRKTGLTLSQQERVLSDALTQHLTKTFPKSSKILCLHTSKRSTPFFVIDFHQKRTAMTDKTMEIIKLENRWFDRCKEIINRGEQNAQEASYQTAFLGNQESDQFF